ncbi:sigma factor-like helix-turn-helix DNA-binding protein [Listeria marthii]|uniref:sigma factor-like helix-turn-helix DNA-binding protein n=1 Tax=Listeria marthii TaxID=529731 RepID=UPI001888E7DF|nr:sigma factor-like helix-turn-helix DNA-binding protein [Listeria marthii]MBF2536414.1 hypothetical protein [Listeria marthii]
MSDFSDLIWEYKIGLRHASIMRNRVKLDGDKKLLKDIITSMSEVIECMETGISTLDYRPESNYKTNSVAYYSDMTFVSFLNYQQELQKTESEELSSFETAIIYDLMKELTPRQKDVFLLINKSGFSIKSVARMLDIKRKTVEDHLRKAEKKIEERKKKSQLWQLRESEKNE